MSEVIGMSQFKLPKVGRVIDGYRIIDRPAFLGRAPYAEIVGPVNAGVQVILCRWEQRKEAQA